MVLIANVAAFFSFVIAKLFRFLTLVLMSPFTLFGSANQWVHSAYQHAEPSDRHFFWLLFAAGSIHIVIFVNLTNITLFQIIGTLGGFYGN